MLQLVMLVHVLCFYCSLDLGNFGYACVVYRIFCMLSCFTVVIQIRNYLIHPIEKHFKEWPTTSVRYGIQFESANESKAESDRVLQQKQQEPSTGD